MNIFPERWQTASAPALTLGVPFYLSASWTRCCLSHLLNSGELLDHVIFHPALLTISLTSGCTNTGGLPWPTKAQMEKLIVTYCESLGWHWIYKLLPLWVWKHVKVLKRCFVYGNHGSSFLGTAWHLKVQNERCVIPVKHVLHFRGAVLPLRDPYRKFCLLEYQGK